MPSTTEVINPADNTVADGDGVSMPSTTEVANDSNEESYVPDDESNINNKLLEAISDKEINDNTYFSKMNNTSDDATQLFSNTELEDLRKRELALMQRNEKGYYRSKIHHVELYRKMSAAYQPYITEPM